MLESEELKQELLELSMASYDSGSKDATESIIEALLIAIQQNGDIDVKLSDIILGLENRKIF